MLSGVRVSAACPMRCGEGRRRDDSFHRRRCPPATGTGSGWFGAVGRHPGDASMTTPRTGRPRRPARSGMASRLLHPSVLLIHLRLQRTARVDFHQSASASSIGVRRRTIEAAGTHGWLIDVKQAPSATRRLKTTTRTGKRGAWFRLKEETVPTPNANTKRPAARQAPVAMSPLSRTTLARVIPAPAEAAQAPARGSDGQRTMIAELAYFRAERRGFAPGGELRDWLEAEAEVRARLDA